MARMYLESSFFRQGMCLQFCSFFQLPALLFENYPLIYPYLENSKINNDSYLNDLLILTILCRDARLLSITTRLGDLRQAILNNFSFQHKALELFHGAAKKAKEETKFSVSDFTAFNGGGGGGALIND